MRSSLESQLHVPVERVESLALFLDKIESLLLSLQRQDVLDGRLEDGALVLQGVLRVTAAYHP